MFPALPLEEITHVSLRVFPHLQTGDLIPSISKLFHQHRNVLGEAQYIYGLPKVILLRMSKRIESV